MILQIFGPYGEIGIMRTSEAGNEAAEGGREGGGAPGAAGSRRDPPRWESRRVCPVFPRGSSPCSRHHPEVLPAGPAVIPVFGTATSGLGRGGNGMGSPSLWFPLGKPWIGVSPPGAGVQRREGEVFLPGGCTGMPDSREIPLLALGFSSGRLKPG